MTEAERKKLFKVNSVYLGLNILLCVVGMLLSLGGLLLIWDNRDLTGIFIRLINHIIIYSLVIFYSSYGYRIKKVNLIRIIAIVFAALSLTSSSIFLAASDFPLPMSILNIIAAVSVAYFAIRVNHKIERNIACGLALLLLFIYAVLGCASIDSSIKEYRFFTCLSMFAPFIVAGSIVFSFFLTKQPRFHVMNPPDEKEIEHIIL